MLLTPSPPPAQPRTHTPALHVLSKTINPASHSSHGEGAAEHAGRNQIYTAASYRSTPQGYSEPNRPLCPQQPRQASYACLRHPTLTCWPFDFRQPNQRPPGSPTGVASFALRVSFLPPRCLPGQSPSQPVPLSAFRTQGRLSPFARPTPLQRCSLVASPAWLLRARAIAVADRQPSTHRTQCVIEPIPTLAAINTPVRLGNPLPLAKHVSSLQGVRRGGGECHPVASPDRLATHEMTLSTRTHDASSGLHATKASNEPTSAPNSSRGCAGHTANKYVPHCGTRSVVAWPPNATSCLLGRRLIVIRSIPQLLLPLLRAAPDATPGLIHVHDQGVVRVTYKTRHWLKPAILSSGVSSAVATAQVLRFSAMIIGPSRAEHR